MRSWMGAMTALAAVVMMVQVSRQPSGPSHWSRSPAKASRVPSPARMQNGCLGPPGQACHS